MLLFCIAWRRVCGQSSTSARVMLRTAATGIQNAVAVRAGRTHSGRMPDGTPAAACVVKVRDMPLIVPFANRNRQPTLSEM